MTCATTLQKQYIFKMSKLEIFFCSAPQSDDRLKLAAEMWAMWQKTPGISLTALYPERGQSYEFQRTRRMIAEKRAKGDIYILTDDDIEPDWRGVPDWLQRGCRLLEFHPEFASLHPWLDGIGRWTPEGYEVFEDDEVVQHHSAGGIRFIRKGCMKEWPEQTNRGYDGTQGAYLLQNGWRTGYLKNLKATHHGEGKRSDLWADIYKTVNQ